MVPPGPQGTVQYPIGAPNEHSLRTKIMEKSLALFFYCYQSVVHLQGSLSFTPLSSQSPLFSRPFYLYLPTPTTTRTVDFTLPSCFPPPWCLILRDTGGEEG